MSLKDKFRAVNQGLGEGIGEAPKQGTERPKTAPGQLLVYTDLAQKAQARAEQLEQRVRDLEKQTLPLDAMSPNPWQPRRVFDEDEILVLAGSIAEIGLIQPVIVRSVSIRDTLAKNESVSIRDTPYQIVAGERRWRAHQKLGKPDIRVIIAEVSDEEMASIALAENFDREDLTAYEIALAIRNAEAAFPSRKSLASALGINRTDLYKYLTYFQLPDFILVELDVTPSLLGRDAAQSISAGIKNHGDKAVTFLEQLWPRVKSGDLDQGKIASTIEAMIARKDHVPTDRDIRKLFVGKEQAGSITRDAKKFQVTIKTAALDPDKERALREFVEGLLQR